MTEKTTTRREYLRQFGGLSIAGMAPNTNSHRNDPQIYEDVRGADLLIPESATPLSFATATEPTEVPLVEQLQASDIQFADPDTVTRGFWAGHNEANPCWVLSCLAFVCGQPLDRQVIETVGSQVAEEFVAEYDAETSQAIEFEQSRTRYATMTDWRTDIVHSDPIGDPSASAPDVLFTDMMRLQYHENVLLGTVVFGPDGSTPCVERMLTRYARLQRSRLRTHTTGL